ncbi:AMP-binding protein, partial [Saccharopolyspora rhizosphaerae]
MPAVEISYTSGTSDVPLLGDTIGENLQRAAEQHPDRDALVEVTTGRRWTYREFLAEVDTAALGLLEAGIVQGDRVGIWAPNRAEWTVVQYATARIGAVLVNINPAYRAHELEYVLNQAGVRMLVSAKAFKTSDYVTMIEQVRPRCVGLEQVVLFDDPTWDRLLEQGGSADPQRLRDVQATLSADDAINIQYTSGTTGFPKGATLSHHNILN